MIGQLSFQYRLLYVLIDFGATYNFITRGIVERLELDPTLVEHIYIEMTNEDKIVNNQMPFR